MSNGGTSPLMLKSSELGLRISNMVGYVRANRKPSQASILNQVLRSGTSIMANVSEAQFAQSKADFISKFHIALKEANETRTWLTLLQRNRTLTGAEAESLISNCNEVIAMLVASINTSKKNNFTKDINKTQCDKPKDDKGSEGIGTE